MEPTASNASGKIVGALIIGLLVGFAAGVFWQERRTGGEPRENTALNISGTEADSNAVATSTRTASLRKTGELPVANLIIKDQPASERVGVASFDAKETVWVAVREEKDGKLGNILGVQKVFIGDKQAAIVELLRPTISGGAYRVVFYRDIGDPAFNYREDTMVEGLEGKFMAQ